MKKEYLLRFAVLSFFSCTFEILTKRTKDLLFPWSYEEFSFSLLSFNTYFTFWR